MNKITKCEFNSMISFLKKKKLLLFFFFFIFLIINTIYLFIFKTPVTLYSYSINKIEKQFEIGSHLTFKNSQDYKNLPDYNLIFVQSLTNPIIIKNFLLSRNTSFEFTIKPRNDFDTNKLLFDIQIYEKKQNISTENLKIIKEFINFVQSVINSRIIDNTKRDLIIEKLKFEHLKNQNNLIANVLKNKSDNSLQLSILLIEGEKFKFQLDEIDKTLEAVEKMNFFDGEGNLFEQKLNTSNLNNHQNNFFITIINLSVFLLYFFLYLIFSKKNNTR